MIRDTGGNGHRRALQRRDSTCATHRHMRRVTQIAQTEIRDEIFGQRVAKTVRDRAVDVFGILAGIGDCSQCCFEGQPQRALVGFARVARLADAGNRAAIAQSGHERPATGSSAPCTARAASEPRKHMTSAMSAGATQRLKSASAYRFYVAPRVSG